MSEEYEIPYDVIKDLKLDAASADIYETCKDYLHGDKDKFMYFCLEFFARRTTVKAYTELDGKGNVSSTGLLDVKAALDILAGNNKNLGSSSGGCNSGLEGIIFLAAALGLSVFMRNNKYTKYDRR